jgi:hypothetical protein
VDNVHKLDHNIVRSHGGSTNQARAFDPPPASWGGISRLHWQRRADVLFAGKLAFPDIPRF